MTFQKGDMVLYGAQGVCRIADVTEKEFHGVCARYYILKPVYDSRSTLFVPADRVDLSEKMRRVLSPEEIEQLVQAIPDETPEWIEDDTERAQQYRSILSSGDRAKLVRMIKALYLRKEALAEKGRKLRTADEHFFKEAEKILYDEFALVLHIKPEQALPFIMQRIELKLRTGAE